MPLKMLGGILAVRFSPDIIVRQASMAPAVSIKVVHPESINQSIDQAINQPINQSINQWINH